MMNPSSLRFFIIFLILSHQLVALVDGRRLPRKRFTATAPPFLDSEEVDSTEVDDDGRVYKNPRNSPSVLCPRDEEQATLMGQKCLRKCSSDEDCKSKKKKCRCDGACGMSCIKPERECPELSHPDLGAVTTTGRLFGDRASYTCTSGFHVVGLQERSCQADGSWSGNAPACKQNIYCKSPPHIDNARNNALPEQNTFDLDSTLQYQCYPGYVTNGFPKAKCLAIDGVASWFGPDISCEPRSCGAPEDISNGWQAGECYTFGCRVSYHCADGFELAGRGDRYCQADGTWSPKELPVCVQINCGHPGPLYNGWIENIEAGTGLGASLIFRCHDGMKLEGNTSSVCLADGHWRYPLPKCLAPCVVPAVRQGRVVLLSSDNETLSDLPLVVPHGEKLRVLCEPRYEFLANNTPVACNNGTWTHIPRCEPARCKRMPRAPRNGMVIAPKTDHGMRARFKCKDGYTLRGGNTTECQYGNWTGDIPYCQEVYCPFPGYIENGRVMLVGNMGVYDYRPYVRKVTNNKQIMYECERGYVLADGPPGATCIGGRWSPKQLPRCVPGLHPRLRWSRSVRSVHSIQDTVARIKRALSMGGHQTQQRQQLAHRGGASTSNRNEEHRRSRNKSKARKMKRPRGGKTKAGPCEVLSSEPVLHVELVKAGRDSNQTYSHNTVIRVSCGQGYALNLGSNNTARCVRGQWRPSKPECVIRE